MKIIEPKPGSGLSGAAAFLPLSMLRCPQCGRAGLSESDADGALECPGCASTYRKYRGIPVLLKSGNNLFKPEDYERQDRLEPTASRKWKGLVPGISVNLSAKERLSDIKEALVGSGKSGAVVIIGAGEQRAALERMFAGTGFVIICCDIDKRADVHYFGDAHDLPFADGVFDAAITTAVLEHLVDPQKAVSEIHRVLKPGGLVYSEVPFMQQVHEGAYDFTRFTLGGHRRLFRDFEEHASGQVAGPATALLWSLENFLRSFSDNPAVRAVLTLCIRLPFFWLKYLDYHLGKSESAADAASCTFFLGRRSERTVPDEEIISRYRGRRTISHV